MPKPQLTVVLGPTASGKTDYAIEIAKKMEGAPGIRGAEVISADSRQVYRGMNIGTAKVKDTQGVPHHLLDMREPNQPLSLSEWQGAAFEVIDQLIREGKQPILVGGTMLYIDSVIFNFDIPQVSPDQIWRAEKETTPASQLYAELLEKDPEAKNFIEPKNTRRIIRALEVMKVTGKPFSQARKQREPKYDVKIVGLFPGPASAQGFGEAQWDELRRRIEIRVEKMFEEGLLEEMAGLRQKYGKDLALLSTLNYHQAAAVLDGKMSVEEATADMVRANTRYAHRQMSWWKGRGDITWIQTPTPPAVGTPPS